MPDLEKIQRRILRTEEFEETIGEYDWKDFESIVSEIFVCNDYRVRNNFRFKTSKRWENDIIAVKNDAVFCIDCKRWSGNRDKKWQIVKAAQEQKVRTKNLERFIRKNPIAKSVMNIPDVKFVPMVVTLHQEDVKAESGVNIVPVNKLNAFILNYQYII